MLSNCVLIQCLLYRIFGTLWPHLQFSHSFTPKKWLWNISCFCSWSILLEYICDFHQISHLGRVGLVVAMSMYLSVPFPCNFFRMAEAVSEIGFTLWDVVHLSLFFSSFLLTLQAYYNYYWCFIGWESWCLLYVRFLTDPVCRGCSTNSFVIISLIASSFDCALTNSYQIMASLLCTASLKIWTKVKNSRVNSWNWDCLNIETRIKNFEV